MSENGQHNDILQQWLEATTQLVMPVQIGGNELVVIYHMVDVIGILAEGDVSNPLLAALQSSLMGGGAQKVDLSDPRILPELLKACDKAAILAIDAPPLLEAGHEVGISVASLPIDFKIKFFTKLAGLDGSEVQALKTFRPKQKPGVAPRSTSKTVRSKSR